MKLSIRKALAVGFGLLDECFLPAQAATFTPDCFDPMKMYGCMIRMDGEIGADDADRLGAGLAKRPPLGY